MSNTPKRPRVVLTDEQKADAKAMYLSGSRAAEIAIKHQLSVQTVSNYIGIWRAEREAAIADGSLVLPPPPPPPAEPAPPDDFPLAWLPPLKLRNKKASKVVLTNFAKILDAIELGMSEEAARQLLLLKPAEYVALKRAIVDVQVYLDGALQKFHFRNLKSIQAHSTKDWKAALARLEKHSKTRDDYAQVATEQVIRIEMPYSRGDGAALMAPIIEAQIVATRQEPNGDDS